ncbi:hypothetical protein [Paenibacillus sp. 23TSA30-6]|uniref:hypothetical protein n=1 Tax=Paenibacillus sp. 23TSA30-6 TaxID=2546104 RepID=UPI001787C288|nr:hypothetical protein [Paenibacillus sp. 23TSA30-6]MBE0339383.1 hypothetical protein [Paenibacillus sp. 23TSA30-6]
MEMEYNLMLRYGAKEARTRMNNVFADKDSAKSLISAALERVNNPLTRDKSSAQLGFEKNFLNLFIASWLIVNCFISESPTKHYQRFLIMLHANKAQVYTYRASFLVVTLPQTVSAEKKCKGHCPGILPRLAESFARMHK